MARFGTEARHRSGSSVAPVRTCVGCRGRGFRTDLLRVVSRPAQESKAGVSAPQDAVAASVVPDPRRRLPGRGAWIHPSWECVHAAERRRAFARALRVRGNPDTRPLAEYMAQIAPVRGGADGR
ncbi:YlxR family protein [Tomitella fengzijianii]|uniref:YlxR family protein n=1 Tax=Tomitella fengzijianii TaxID=2597660 RepID=A0A516X3L6_9ACTN|nr:YlxR family protein [Tomitella fengzijianii]QDQ97669.1 YlxR family protein [Tomitella fengzijianii]